MNYFLIALKSVNFQFLEGFHAPFSSPISARSKHAIGLDNAKKEGAAFIWHAVIQEEDSLAIYISAAFT
jgi:hypothetical protein